MPFCFSLFVFVFFRCHCFFVFVCFFLIRLTETTGIFTLKMLPPTQNLLNSRSLLSVRRSEYLRIQADELSQTLTRPKPHTHLGRPGCFPRLSVRREINKEGKGAIRMSMKTRQMKDLSIRISGTNGSQISLKALVHTSIGPSSALLCKVFPGLRPGVSKSLKTCAKNRVAPPRFGGTVRVVPSFRFGPFLWRKVFSLCFSTFREKGAVLLPALVPGRPGRLFGVDPIINNLV